MYFDQIRPKARPIGPLIVLAANPPVCTDRQDPDANASYLSVWGDSPSTNLASPEWRAELKRILTRWITTLKLDGCTSSLP